MNHIILSDKSKDYLLVDNITGKTPKQITKVEFKLDSDKLIVTFFVNDNYIAASKKQYNSDIYNEEVVELFVGTKQNKERYLEMEVNPLNTQFCAMIKNDGKTRILQFREKCIFESSVTVVNYGYIVTLKIPIKKLLSELDVDSLDELTLNAYRIDRPKDGEWELSALSPTGVADFHKPNSFIKVKENYEY